jgi:hypothetical protein
VVHEGLTEMQLMKLGMFKTVARHGIRILGLALSVCVVYSLLHALL